MELKETELNNVQEILSHGEAITQTKLYQRAQNFEVFSSVAVLATSGSGALKFSILKFWELSLEGKEKYFPVVSNVLISVKFGGG